MAKSFAGSKMGNRTCIGGSFLPVYSVSSLSLSQSSEASWPVDTPARALPELPGSSGAWQLVRALESFLAAPGVEQAASALLQEAATSVGAPQGRVLMAVDESANDLEVTASLGLPRELAERRIGPDLPSPAHDAMRLRTVVIVSSPEEWHARFASWAEVAGASGINGCIALPLECEGRLVGALELVLATPFVLSPSKRELLATLARNGAFALDRLRRSDADREARLHAERANQVKADFLAVVSHELRTPLNAIGGYTELLQMGLRGPLTPSQEEDLRRIDHSQRHLLSLVNAILNFAKLDAGRVSFVLTDVNAAEVLADVEPLVQPQARAKGVKIRRDVCDASIRVVADREKLQQVLLNLLTNAIKYTPSGGTVTLRCSTSRRHATFQVTDTGLGIPLDKIERIFEPFVQINRSLSAPNDGIGLGLAISRELARGMRGVLKAASTEGQGSTFTLTLPRGG